MISYKIEFGTSELAHCKSKVEAALFQHNIIIFLSKVVTCRAYICHYSLVSHMETTLQHM